MKKNTSFEDSFLLSASVAGLLAAHLSKRYVFGKKNGLGHVGIIGGDDGPTAIYVTSKESISNSYLLPLGTSKGKLKELLGNFFSFQSIAAILRLLCLCGIVLSSFSLLFQRKKEPF